MLILCCGNPDRGDDAAGFLVAERLKERNIHAQLCTGEPSALLRHWEGAHDVLLIDAVVTDCPTGTIHLWNASETRLPRQHSRSTHGFGVADAIELARKLGCLPGRLRVYGIEADNFDIGVKPSPAVQRAAGDLAEKIASQCASQNSVSEGVSLHPNRLAIGLSE
jgi:hydrogenase maturation protease